MNRDTLMTVGGLLLVCAVVIGVFLYGNAQRNKSNEPAKQTAKTEEKKTESQPKAATSNYSNQNKPSQPAQSQPAPAQQPPAQKPSTAPPSGIQGSQPAPTPSSGGTAQPAPTQTPKTGAGLNTLVATGVMTSALVYYRRSRKALLSSQTAQRSA